MNVILFTIDSLRYDRCSVNGHFRNTTPNLSSLAEGGIVFNKAYATGPFTSESFPGMLAGQHSYNGRYYHNIKWKALTEEDRTLATWLDDEGYDTAAVISNLHLTKRRNFDAGFDHYDNLRAEKDGLLDANDEEPADENDDGGGLIQFGDVLYKIRSQMRQWTGPTNPFIPALVAYRYYQLGDWATVPGEDVINRFIDVLDGLDEPFLAWTHLMDVHGPLHPDRINEAGLDWPARRQFVADAQQLSNRLTPDHHVRYDYSVRYEDLQLGRLIDWLQREGLWDETIIIVTADHGAALYDHDFYGHPPHYPFEESLHVPLVVRIPDCADKRISDPFSLAWLGELIAECLNIDSPSFPVESGVESHLTDDGTGGQPLVADSISSEGHTVVVYDDEWKYARHYGNLTHDWTTVATPDLADALQTTGIGYELRSDPSEYNPMYEGERVRELTQVSERLQTDPGDLQAIGGSFSSGVEDRLKQLGYIID